MIIAICPSCVSISGTATVTLDGAAGDRLRIEVRNPLPGKASESEPGLGLIGLAERVHLAGGEFTYGRTAGEFRVSAWIPWER